MKKVAILHMNIKPEIKAMAVEQAQRQHRSLTNYVEMLILADQVHVEEAKTTPDATPL